MRLRAACDRRYLYPEPRVPARACCSARNRAATACMDLSDGLADAVRQMAEASGVGAIIDARCAADRPGGARDGSTRTAPTR